MYLVPFKSKVKISQNYVAFSEYMNFNTKYKKVKSAAVKLEEYRELLLGNGSVIGHIHVYV